MRLRAAAMREGLCEEAQRADVAAPCLTALQQRWISRSSCAEGKGIATVSQQ